MMIHNRNPMIVFAPIKGAKMSAIGDRIACKGSSGPQEPPCLLARALAAMSPDADFGEVEGDRLRRLPPFVLIFEPMVPARVWEAVTPAFKALTRTLQ